MKDLGVVHYFLGMEVSRTLAGLSLTQIRYILDLLCRTNTHESKPVSTLAVSGHRLSYMKENLWLITQNTVASFMPSNTHFNQNIVASLVPSNTSFNKVCQFMHKPTSTHWLAVKRILFYLQGTSTHDMFHKSSALTLTAYADANYTRDPDDRRSTGSYCLYLGSNLVSWSSKKQDGVSRSSTEAKYCQLAYTAAALSFS